MAGDQAASGERSEGLGSLRRYEESHRTVQSLAPWLRMTRMSDLPSRGWEMHGAADSRCTLDRFQARDPGRGAAGHDGHDGHDGHEATRQTGMRAKLRVVAEPPEYAAGDGRRP